MVAAYPIILSFFSTKEACQIRGASSLLLEVCRQHGWRDATTPVRGNTAVARWSAAHPSARAVKLVSDGARPLTDAGFALLPPGLRFVVMADCALAASLSLRPLAGTIRVLDISGCTGLDDAALICLAGIHTLKMPWCNQRTVSDAGFAGLKSLRVLDISHCNQPGLTSGAFAALGGLESLAMSGCNQPTIGDAAFVGLKRLHTLVMANCSQPSITDAFAAGGLGAGVTTLDVSFCTQLGDASLGHFRRLQEVTMRGCAGLSDAAYASLRGVVALDMGGCVGATDGALEAVAGVTRLVIAGCSGITDAGFVHLERSIRELDMSYCDQEGIR